MKKHSKIRALPPNHGKGMIDYVSGLGKIALARYALHDFMFLRSLWIGMLLF